MYKLLLCWRYLLTRYLALVCIVSVMLGVATLIVVNSVMAGFSTKLRERLHGLLSDIVIEAHDFQGFGNPEGKIALIQSDPFLSQRIEAMTPTLEIFGMIRFDCNTTSIARPVHIIGIDPVGRARVGGFAEHLLLNKGQPSFELSHEALQHHRMLHPPHRLDFIASALLPKPTDGKPAPEPPPSNDSPPSTIIVGYAIAHFRAKLNTDETPKEVRTLQPGDDVIITTISGQGLKPVEWRCAVCDYFRSEMSEYDANYVFVPIEELQRLRAMPDRATSIQVRIKDYRDLHAVKNRLQALLPPHWELAVHTWEDKQGPLLAAISIEKGILNVLLFMIIAVAGFGILAIFSMIVVEKTRDIGILKALGASNRGVLNIFLGYGLLLGAVGALLGSAFGTAITIYINEIEQLLTKWTGHELFDRSVYYFNEIPTDLNVGSVMVINLGAVAIAVLFSVLPALRAALLHPVRALRYE
ncbi:MAG TPA: FtsX-like permease family protein [Gemmataceae bacterium]|nr:FtsX-like permease family protein [Gemmataceae bacterium]